MPTSVRQTFALIALLLFLNESTRAAELKIESKILAIKEEYKVQVHHAYNREGYFPSQWRKAPNAARGKRLPLKEVERLLPIIENFLSTYPKKVLGRNLTDIYLLADLTFYGKSFGATNSRSGLSSKARESEKDSLIRSSSAV